MDLGDFFSTNLGRAAAANSADGVNLGLYTDLDIKNLFTTAQQSKKDTGRAVPGYPPEDEFARRICEVCLGLHPEIVARRGDFLSSISLPSDFQKPWVSTIMRAQILQALFTDDYIRYLRRRGFEITASGTAPAGKSFPNSLLNLGRADRRFLPRLVPPERRWFVWFTLRNRIERALSRGLAGYGAADAIRDILGLVDRAPPEHLFAVHIPVSVLRRRPHFRPTIGAAGAHSRFKTQSSVPGRSANDPWGFTLDLRPLDDLGRLEDGAPERVTFEMQQADFDGDERLEFEYLGKLDIGRSRTGLSDEKFANLLLNGRSIPSITLPWK